VVYSKLDCEASFPLHVIYVAFCLFSLHFSLINCSLCCTVLIFSNSAV